LAHKQKALKSGYYATHEDYASESVEDEKGLMAVHNSEYPGRHRPRYESESTNAPDEQSTQIMSIQNPMDIKRDQYTRSFVMQGNYKLSTKTN